jgi:UDP-arabinose 4-epimerase
MIVLVVGGAGYIGSHTCKELAANGHIPVTFDNLSAGHRDAVRWGPLKEGDILDRQRLVEIFAEYGFDGVVHFAARAYVEESMIDPQKYYRNNVAGTLMLLEVMLEFGLKEIVFSSTCATYGTVGTLPISEDAPQAPINPYGRSKLMVERILQDYDRAYDLKSICLRYFNAAGCDPDWDIGERHDPETHLIPRALMAASGELEDFTVFGTDFPTPDGTAIRDYIHVKDLARAHVQAIEQLVATRSSEAINLGTGQGLSIREVMDAVERNTRATVRHRIGARRPGDPAELVADNRKAARVLGFRPQYSDIDTIIATAWRWQTMSKRRRSVLG